MRTDDPRGWARDTGNDRIIVWTGRGATVASVLTEDRGFQWHYDIYFEDGTEDLGCDDDWPGYKWMPFPRKINAI